MQMFESNNKNTVSTTKLNYRETQTLMGFYIFYDKILDLDQVEFKVNKTKSWQK